MARTECGREAETIRTAWDGRQAADDPDLAAHLLSCPTCAEVAALARALREDRDAACAEARVPSSAMMWWRAQRRAQAEAARRAERPIALVHAISLGCAGAAAVALASLGAPRVQEWLAGSRVEALEWRLPAPWQAEAALGWPAVAMLVLVASLVVIPLAISLVFAEDR